MSATLPATQFEALRDHLLAHSVKRGDFVLKSGRRSSWFIDSKQTVCRPEAMVLVADAILSILPDDVIAIGGLTMEADPVAFITAGVAAEGIPFRALLTAPDLGFDYEGG
jgi:orotate phosphoribosyltransferase